MHKVFKSTLIIFGCVLALTTTHAEAKKFQRALVITGGGISPAVGLGILAAAEERGWIPDVVITTCGASITAAIYNAYMNSRDSLAYAQSSTFHQGLSQIRLETRDVQTLMQKTDHIRDNLGKVPPIFDRLILNLPTNVEMALPNTQFNSTQRGPRFIMVAAKSSVGPGHVGQPINGKIFTETFFTDPDTAAAIQGFQSPLPSSGYVQSATQTISNVSTQAAMRNSVADPLLLNPGTLNGSYFFTGAIDLYPFELAQYLADDVMATYPVSLFKDYEDVLIQGTFGFTQTSRALNAVNNNSVKWIDLYGVDPLKFDPTNSGLTLYSRIPTQLGAFQQGIQAQYDFGKQRMQEAFAAQPNGPSRRHLRAPINPALLSSFTCNNAYVWKTDQTTRECSNDAWAGCDRRKATNCIPVR